MSVKIANTVLSCKKGNIFGLREFIFTMDVPVDSALSGIALGQLNFQNLFQEAFVCNYIVTEDLVGHTEWTEKGGKFYLLFIDTFFIVIYSLRINKIIPLTVPKIF